MPVLRDIATIARVTARGTRRVARGVRATVSGTTTASRWVRRNVGSARQRGGAGNVGLMRLLDLHAASCAGDTLVTIGLAGTIFFGVAAGEARSRVALYLLVTMVPFALLAPVVGPLLDRFRHGRRYALSATMLGRGVLAWLIADNLLGFGLYPAAFGVLALSRAYGVARSAAVPRLLPPGLGLSQAGARASVYGTVAGALVAPIGAIAFTLGPQWPLRVASVIFLIGAVVALNLPPKADSDPPEVVPKLFHLPWRHRAENGDRVLHGRLVIATLIGSASLRALYGFLLLFLAFVIKVEPIPGRLLGLPLGEVGQLALVGGALGLGTFVATAIGTGLRIRRPARLQAFGLVLVALAATWATLRFTFVPVLVLALATAVASGLAKLAVDASIQERIPETVRASAFAHAETLLMLAWVAGGALGLIPMTGRLGLAVAALAVAAAATRAIVMAWRLRTEVLRGRSLPTPATPAPPPGTRAGTGHAGPGQAGTSQAGTSQAGIGQAGTGQAGGTAHAGTGQVATDGPAAVWPYTPTPRAPGPAPAHSGTPVPAPASSPALPATHPAQAYPAEAHQIEAGRVEAHQVEAGRVEAGQAHQVGTQHHGQPGHGQAQAGTVPRVPAPATPPGEEEDDPAPPGYHVFRPSPPDDPTTGWTNR